MEYYSPALSVNSDMTDEELDKYFASYVPLSNLPTPPQPKDLAAPTHAQLSASPFTPSSTSQSHDVLCCPELEGHAIHLTNLVPLNVSTHRPHALVVQGFLERARLPDDLIAYSACILDALSTRFAAAWRDAVAPSDYAKDLKNFLRTDSRQHFRLSPDVIVLAALALAHDFLVDRLRSSQHWSVRESAGMFTVQEIESTKRAILQDMDYGLFRISQDRVQRRLRAMQLAASGPAASAMAVESNSSPKASRSRILSVSLAGSSVWSHGVQTPEPSP